MNAAIEAIGLEKTYPNGVKALDGLSFDVAPGTIFGLLGPNGAGKSTTVKILTTLAKQDNGRATVAGIDVARDPDRVRRTIGVVAQGSGVDVQATGRENLRLQGHIYGLRGESLERRASALLERFGLAEAADRITRGYSGGMLRRLDIAVALIHDPQVLFLDEPTTGLDPEVRADMWSEIARLAHTQGKSVLLTTHYLEEADQLAARLAIVDRGKIVAEGTPDELKSELRGDALHIDIANSAAELNGSLHSALERIGGVRDVVIDGQTLRARADDGGRAVPSVLQALEASGISVASVRVSRPSLDDVYLRYTGRTFGAAEAAAATNSQEAKKWN
jgi:ABC-2 type transport system ATP-binding protein